MNKVIVYTGRTEEAIPNNLLRAVDAYFAGDSISVAAQNNHITYKKLSDELKTFRKCKSMKCKSNICRAGKRGKGNVVYCSALIDTKFPKNKCPFYKSYSDFYKEYDETSKKGPFIDSSERSCSMELLKLSYTR